LLKIEESGIFALQNKIPFNTGIKNNIDSGVNLDSVLCSQYLKQVAIKRKIKIIDDLVVGFESEGKDIKNILLSNTKLNVDFVFDCSGFNRIVIGKFYQQNWTSLSDTLPINQSVVGQVPLQDKLPPYVKTTALDYGWSFEIPTSERYGVGYNFDNNYLSEEDAVIELKKKINSKWEPARSIKYNTGFYENQSVGNCIAVGLSGSFFEPMEASSLMTTTFILDKIVLRFNEYFTDKINFIKNINNDLRNIQQDIVSAIYVHYITNKTNNDFWKNFTKNNKIPEKVQQFLVFSVNSIAQYAINDYMDVVQFKELGQFYQQKRDFFRNLLQQTKFI
jgi:tryptophan halogenase